LANASEKLERAQNHAEDRRIASQKTIERLQREYDEMAIERKENDKEIEELRAKADEIEDKVCIIFVLWSRLSSLSICSESNT
jgi:kinetochore protein Nuf2